MRHFATLRMVQFVRNPFPVDGFQAVIYISPVFADAFANETNKLFNLVRSPSHIGNNFFAQFRMFVSDVPSIIIVRCFAHGLTTDFAPIIPVYRLEILLVLRPLFGIVRRLSGRVRDIIYSAFIYGNRNLVLDRKRGFRVILLHFFLFLIFME